MAIQFHPQPGTILICDFQGMQEPEMVKRRPVVVISPRLRNRGNLVSVVPLSSTRPDDSYPYHHQLRFEPPLPAPYDDPTCWVKGDMVYTVAFYRLFVPQLGKDPKTGKRQSDIRVLTDGELTSVMSCVLNGIGLGHLTDHL
jgi:uncharacterized protein YifN (PemK superfamily)